jgi:serine/threonine protein kinase
MGMPGGLDPTIARAPVDETPPNTDIFTQIGLITASSKASVDVQPVAAKLPEIPGYEVNSVLGRGGMGIVYLARHQRLNRIVALKMVLGGSTPPEEVLERFRKEALAVARLNHPNITQVYDSGEWESLPYLALEFVAGGTLADRLAGIPQAPLAAAALLETLARAIAHAHQQGIVHRDLKPGNILLSTEPGSRNSEPEENSQNPACISSHHVPKITDFGLARWIEGDTGQQATRDGDLLGTPSYMAPEQAGGVFRNVGPASDVYALGAILYELLTGRPPFRATSAVETVLQVLSVDPVPPRRLQPNVPKDLETICLKCLEKTPARRYPSAEALADDLRRFVDGRPILARPVGVLPRTLKWARRRPAAAALTGVSILALLVILAGSAWYNARLSNELDRSETLNARLSTELNRSEKMFGDSHRLIKWLLEDHTDGLLGLRGSTSVQKKLVAQMLAYLDALSDQIAGHNHISADLTIEDVATAYERLSNVQGNPDYINLGETREALESCRKALDLRRRVLAVRPADPTAGIGLANCLMKSSELHAALGEFPAARAALNEARDLADAALREQPDHFVTRILFIHLIADDADLRQQQGDPDAALAGHREVLRMKEMLFGVPPASANGRFALASSHSRIGRLLEERADFTGAQAHYRDALKLTRGLVKEKPDDPRSQREVGVALIASGDLSVSKDAAYRPALESYEQALAIRRAQFKADPDGKSGMRDLLVTLERVGLCRQMLKDLPGAADDFREALKISLLLAQADPDSVENRRNVWIEHGKLGGVLWAAGKFDEAAGHFAEKLRLANDLIVQFARSRIDWEGVAEAHMELAPTGLAGLPPQESSESLRDRYKSAAEHCRLCLSAYEKVAELAPLEPRQLRVRDAARKMLQLVEDLGKLLESSKK